jgi:hypothetical protein
LCLLLGLLAEGGEGMSTRKRWWLACGAVLALSVLAADVAVYWYSSDPIAESVERAVQAVERLGGKVVRDETAPGKPVTEVDLSGTAITDTELKELAALNRLQLLDLHNTGVTDLGLKELTELEQLQVLNLRGTRVTDVGLKELLKLKQLQWLDLTDTLVMGPGLKELAGLSQLQTLAFTEHLGGKDQLIRKDPPTISQLKQLKTAYVYGVKHMREGVGSRIHMPLWYQSYLPDCEFVFPEFSPERDPGFSLPWPMRR